VVRPRELDDDLNEEIAAHLAEAADEYRRQGLSPKEARLAALSSFGSVTQIQEAYWDVRSFRWLDDALRDLQYAVRTLRRAPHFTLAVVLTLGLGMGANTAIFSLIDSLLLRALPVVEPHRLVRVASRDAIDQGFPFASMSYPLWDQFRQRAQLFDGAVAWSPARFNIAQGGETQPVDGLYANGTFFDTLGVPLFLGRGFTPTDDASGGGPDGPVAVISYSFWRRRFGRADNTIGAQLVVERIPFTIIGIAPPDFFGVEVGRTFDVALPISTEPLVRGEGSVLDTPLGFLQVMLRLKLQQSLDAATAVLRTVQPQMLQAALPANIPPRVRQAMLKNPFVLVPASAGMSRLRQRYQRPLLTLLGIAALILLIACANIVNLLLARAVSRRHELQVRLALGAPRWRLAQQLLVESLVLASMGTVVGLALAHWGSRALVAEMSTTATRVFLALSLDWRLLGFTTAVTILTAVLFGTVPAVIATRDAPVGVLKEHGRAASGEARGGLSSVIVVQVGLSLVLVVAAGLFLRTFERLATRPLGFDPDRVLVVNVNTTHANIRFGVRSAFYYQLVEALASLPGVAQAAGSEFTPLTGSFDGMRVDVPGAPSMSEPEHGVRANAVTPGWFAAYGTPIRAGRDVNDRDSALAPPVLMINETFARAFFPDRNPIGQVIIDVGDPRRWVRKTVVAVVGDAAYVSLRERVQPTVYAPLAQWEVPTGLDTSISIRALAGSPALLTHSVAEALTTVDRNLTFTFRPLADQVDASLTQERMIAMLSGFFGALALLLAALGLYGVTSYAVTKRRAEIGIRIALGAQPGNVVRLMLSRILFLVLLGVLVGGAVSLWASRFIATLLYGIEARDPATLLSAAVVLMAVAGLAGWLPTWRAARIDPAEVLREI
jgi:predicted permease